MNAINPYAALRADLDSPSEPTRRSNRAALRLFPVAYFGLFALVGLSGSIALPGVVAWAVWRTGDLGVIRSRQFNEILLIIPALVVLGLAGYLTARSWFNCRWKRAIWVSIGFFLLIGLGAGISQFMLHR